MAIGIGRLEVSRLPNDTTLKAHPPGNLNVPEMSALADVGSCYVAIRCS